MDPRSPHLLRIDDLTRRYARYSRHQAGLGAAWAGLCLALVGGLVLASDLARYNLRPAADQTTGFWRFLMGRPSQDPEPGVLVAALALPALWLLGRWWVQRRVYERDGIVIGQETDSQTATRHVYTAIEIAAPCAVIPLQWIVVAIHGFAVARLPGALATTAIALALPIVGRRLASGLDRAAWLLLILGSSILISGGAAESQLASLLAYGLLGLVLAASGLRSHWQFLRARRELAALSGSAGVAAIPASNPSSDPLAP